MIDSRDFIAAKRRAETEIMLPPGPRVALTGGLDFNDHHLIWDRLDKVRAKHPDMVLIHGGSTKGAELIASKRATARKMPQIAFKPDWTKHAKAAPFKRNDAMLELLPLASCIFRARESRTTSPTRQSASALRCGNLAAHERRFAIFCTTNAELHRRNSAWFRLYTLARAAVLVEGATMTSMHMEPPRCLPLDFS